MDHPTAGQLEEVRALVLRERARLFEESLALTVRLSEVIADIRVELALRHGEGAQVIRRAAKD